MGIFGTLEVGKMRWRWLPYSIYVDMHETAVEDGCLREVVWVRRMELTRS